MKKIITISIFTLLILAVPVFVSAQGSQQGQAGQQQDRVQDPTTYNDTATVSPQDQAGQQQDTPGNKGIEIAAQSLNRVIKRNNNPEIGEQVRTMVQNHEQVQVRTETALQQMNQRNETVKFMIGPDYKNAGQVRSDVVGLRNDIKQLEQIKTKTSPTDAGDVQGAIDELEVEADALEVDLTEQLSGFSLFGWLAKLLAR